MSDQLSEPLRRHIGQAVDGRIGVLVHVAEGTDPGVLESSGFSAKRVISEISVVTGSVPADEAALHQLIDTPGVVEVEPDYEATTQI